MSKNKGYTMIELIIVIAIIVILAGGGTVSYLRVQGYYVKQCAKELESQLNKARASSLGKNSMVLSVYRDASDSISIKIVYDGDDTNAEVKKIGRKNLTVTYSLLPDGSNPQTLGATPIEIEFDRSSGEIKNPSGNCVRKIFISQGNTTKTITLYQETGKISLE